MEINDYEKMFNGVTETNENIKTSVIPEGVGSNIIDVVNIDERIEELKEKAKQVEIYYDTLISKLDLKDDEAVEYMAKNQILQTIKSEKSLVSKIETMSDIILLQMQADPLKDKTRDFIAISELQSKVNSNIVKYTKEVNKLINDRKNADRQDQKASIMINNFDNSQNLNIGADEGEKMILKLDDLYEFGKTGNIETTQRLGEIDECKVIE